MIDSAAPHCPVLPGEFDARPELFNCRNGTLELPTMTFREHRKEDMLTKQAAVDYDPHAECPQWLAHLDLIFGRRHRLSHRVPVHVRVHAARHQSPAGDVHPLWQGQEREVQDD